MELQKYYPLKTPQFVPPPPPSPPTDNILTCSQPENLRMCEHPKHPLTHMSVHQQSHKILLNFVLQELLSEFHNLGRSQHIDYHSSQVTTTTEVVETVNPHNPKDLYPTINALSALYNPSTTVTPSISATTALPSVISQNIYLHSWTITRISFRPCSSS